MAAGQFLGVAATAAAHQIFDTTGSLLFRNPGTVNNEAREYRVCRTWRGAGGDTVQVQYNNYATHGGPMRVVHRQSY
jgi:hypothetical protein